MRVSWERRDVLLFLVLIMLIVNTLLNLPLRKLNAETFKLDNCITAEPGDKPGAYLHVVTH